VRLWRQIRPHILTCTIVGWLPIFTRPETVEIVLDSWRLLQDNNRQNILRYVILKSFIHLVTFSDNLSTQIGDFKSYTARVAGRAWSAWSSSRSIEIGVRNWQSGREDCLWEAFPDGPFIADRSTAGARRIAATSDSEMETIS
jgi:hypothetical protein